MSDETPPVTFDNADWIARFPEFTAVGGTLGQTYFNRATLFCANTLRNPALTNCAGETAVGMLKDLLYLMTSHIAWLNAPRDAQGNPAASGTPANPVVGRVSQAHEGSVSVSLDMGEANAGSPSQAWYMQTRYGSEFWYATASARTFRYAPGPLRNFEPVYPGYFPGGRYRGF